MNWKRKSADREEHVVLQVAVGQVVDRDAQPVTDDVQHGARPGLLVPSPRDDPVGHVAHAVDRQAREQQLRVAGRDRQRDCGETAGLVLANVTAFARVKMFSVGSGKAAVVAAHYGRRGDREPRTSPWV